MISIRNRVASDIQSSVSSALFASVVAVIVSAISMVAVIALTTALYAAHDSQYINSGVSEHVVPLETTLNTEHDYYVYPTGNTPMLFTT